MGRRRVAVLAAALIALAYPVQAFAGLWTWGFNNMSQSTNSYEHSGWNYWQYQYVDKRSGGTIKGGWTNQANGYACEEDYSGYPLSVEITPSDVGCGGYLDNVFNYWSGGASYIYLESYA